MFGKAIIFFRKEKNLTQQQLSQMTGIAQCSISKIEADKVQTGDHSLNVICKAMGITISELIAYKFEHEFQPKDNEESDIKENIVNLFKELHSDYVVGVDLSNNSNDVSCISVFKKENGVLQLINSRIQHETTCKVCGGLLDIEDDCYNCFVNKIKTNA